MRRKREMEIQGTRNETYKYFTISTTSVWGVTVVVGLSVMVRLRAGLLRETDQKN